MKFHKEMIRHNQTSKIMGKNSFYPAGIYMLKDNNRNTRTRCEICSELTIKIPVFLLLTLTYFTPCSTVSIVNFEHVIAGSVHVSQVPITKIYIAS